MSTKATDAEKALLERHGWVELVDQRQARPRPLHGSRQHHA